MPIELDGQKQNEVLDKNKLLQIADNYALEFEQEYNCHFLVHPEGIIRLNASSNEILKRCDASKTAEMILAELQQYFPNDNIANDVYEFLQQAYNNKWICYSSLND